MGRRLTKRSESGYKCTLLVSRQFVELTAPHFTVFRKDQAYYVARVMISNDELKRIGNLKLVPGMPAEAHIRTGE